ncbi:MAG: hypothetical protein SNJ78_01355 [Spirochaetales bacterium]
MVFPLKVCITLLLVLIITEISKRINPAIGGILMGLPLGAGLSTFFLAYEQGVPFLINAIPYGILGLGSSLLLSLGYYLTNRWFPHPVRWISALRGSLGGVVIYGAVSYLYRCFSINLGQAVGVTFFVMIFNFFLVRWLIPPALKPPKKKISLLLVLYRAGITGIFIAVVTALAPKLGPVWSGILSAFPIVLYQVMVFLHVEEGPEVYPGIIIGFAYSVGNLLVFYLLLAFLLPYMSLPATYSIVYGVSFVFLYLLNRLRH